MSSDIELALHYDGASSGSFYADDINDAHEHLPPANDPADSQFGARTRKIWHDYLSQFGVNSAILTVTAGNAQRHAFLIGFDHVRGMKNETENLLALVDAVLARSGEQPVHHFQFSRTDLAPSAAQASDLSGQFDWGISIRMKHGCDVIRALFFRREDEGRFTERDAMSLQLVAPILAESATRIAQLARQSRRSAMLEAMFDRVSMSIALLSADGQPLFMNSAASALLAERRWLIRGADGSIVPANSSQAKGMREAIRRAATAHFPVEEVFRLDCRDGDWRLAYVVSAKSRAGGDVARCAMVIVMGPGKVDAPSSLLEALGLLPSEQRFLGHFLKSSSLGNAAEGCGLSEETARTYLKRVRAKLGVHRQMELAGLISGLVLPLRQGDAPSIGDRRDV
jgi:PAS domain-containing protein